MKKFFTIAVLLASLVGVNTAFAGGMALTISECEDILGNWAEDPGSVPQNLVDACKDVLAAAAIKPYTQLTAASVADPCAGPAAANSIDCWGPWAALSPAAGAAVGPITLPPDTPDLTCEDFDCRPQLTNGDDGITPPLGSCVAGSACGFATNDSGLDPQRADTTNTSIVSFAMATDGSSFVVDPGGSGELASNDNLQRQNIPGPPRFGGVVGDTASRLIVLQGQPDATGNFDQATGVWLNGMTTNQTLDNTNSGAFAWGIASSMDTINALNAGNVTASFSGVMSGNPNTTANITVNFGSQPAWNGNWQNPGFAFSAGGPVQAVDLVSDPGQFSSNVKSGYVQGALLGAAGNQSVAHTVNVVLDAGGGNGLVVKDTGLLH